MADLRTAPLAMPAGELRRRHGDRTSIPWSVHERAAAAYNAFGFSQSAERLAQRGGFGVSELIGLLDDPPRYGNRVLAPAKAKRLAAKTESENKS